MIDPNTGLETQEEEKVTFSEKQQALVNSLIQKKQGEAAKAVKEELLTTKTQLETLAQELADAKAALDTAGTKKDKGTAQGDIDAIQAEMAEIKRSAAAQKLEYERLVQANAQKDREVREANNRVIDTQKKIAIQQAASKQNFFDATSIVKLTEDSIKWDPDRQKFIVIGEEGAERMNSSFEPMTLEDYYTEFAQKNPFMVKGDVRGGVGSSESQRSSLTGKGQFDVAQIFGKGSNAALANKMAMDNPQEYKRLKAVARTKGLIG